MNYRHAFHAGNFADVLKHAVLVRILLHLRAKPAAFRVIDTHAGAGRYDLGGPEATRRLVADRFPDLSAEQLDEIGQLSGGLPFSALELAKSPGAGAPMLPPVPAAVTAWRYTLSITSPHANTPGTLVRVEPVSTAI